MPSQEEAQNSIDGELLTTRLPRYAEIAQDLVDQLLIDTAEEKSEGAEKIDLSIEHPDGLAT